MSSGFVSGGTNDNPNSRDAEWLAAQTEIEAKRRAKEEEEGRQVNGKSLYEILQSNKASKQEAFEESIRLKNQFRNLDEDEIEFLDSVLESTRKKEAEVKKETREQVDVFRKQQEEADKALLLELGDGGTGVGAGEKGKEGEREENSMWAINARKRKRAKEKEGGGIKGIIKLRKSSTNDVEKAEVEEKDESIPKGIAGADAGTVVTTTTAQVMDNSTTKCSLSFSPSIKPATNVKKPPPLVSPGISTPSNAQLETPPDKPHASPASVGCGLGLGGYSSGDE